MTTFPAESVISDVGRKYLQLQMTPDLGPIRLGKLLDYFKTPEAVLSASQAELQRIEGIGQQVSRSIFRAREYAGAVETEVERAVSCGARIICLVDDDYPQSLRHITDPPTCIYVKGDLQPQDAVAVAIVGTRRCSHYGKEQATRFGELLARAGFTVISGLARGVDACAHRGALRAGGRTIAVLGNGLATHYPPEHAELSDSIATCGAVITELAVDVGPEAKNFPGRNRIITGLSLGVLVIEAGKRSGALITARLASEYNREVFALPGNIDRGDLTAGTNALIRDGGAKLVTCLDDILDELGGVGDVMRPESPSSEEEAARNNKTRASGPNTTGGVPRTSDRLNRLSEQQRAVYEAVAGGASDLDAACEMSKLDAGTVGSAVTALELAGLVRRLPGNRVEIRRP
jgi:DNA processing protein